MEYSFYCVPQETATFLHGSEQEVDSSLNGVQLNGTFLSIDTHAILIQILAYRALDKAQLLGSTYTNTSAFVGVGTPVSFLDPENALAQEIANPYTDPGRTDYFYSFLIDQESTTIQATISLSPFEVQPVFLTGSSERVRIYQVVKCYYLHWF